ncbi:MAG TPA: tRNA (adenosine(37)-N6)-dimethylallyltransferase MiaA, partial [Myxococcota bacterium]|nr:tRNA (adenosine(37)-N6)-dimethylallyltransferase MiaA [Myxococcota bacterium]
MVSSHLTPVIIAGATGSGKSSLALSMALKFDGEIICADSRQFYRFMQIGTASPNEEERALIPHHGFNIVDPLSKKVDAGFFVTFALTAIARCHEQRKRPITVGGTGLYLRALRYGLNDVPQSDKTIASSLEKECNERGLAAMYEELATIDPSSMRLIMPNDRYRVLRALEIYRKTKTLPSALRTSFSLKKPVIHAHWLLKHGEMENYEAGLRA